MSDSWKPCLSPERTWSALPLLLSPLLPAALLWLLPLALAVLDVCPWSEPLCCGVWPAALWNACCLLASALLPGFGKDVSSLKKKVYARKLQAMMARSISRKGMRSMRPSMLGPWPCLWSRACMADTWGCHMVEMQARCKDMPGNAIVLSNPGATHQI